MNNRLHAGIRAALPLLLSLLFCATAQAAGAEQKLSDEFAKTYHAYNAAYAQGDFVRAAELAVKAVELARKEIGPTHEKTGVLEINAGHALLLSGNIKDAETHLQNAQKILEAAGGPALEELTTVHEDMAKVLASRDDLAGARAEIDRAIAIVQKHGTPDSPQIANYRVDQGLLDVAAGNLDKAMQSYTEALRIVQAKYGKDDVRSASVISAIGEIEVAMKKYAPAEQHFLEALHVFQSKLTEDDPSIVNVHSKLAQLYLATDNNQFAQHADRVIALMKDKEGQALPLFVVQPKPPSGKAAEGWVLLDFTVTEAGRVTDLRVLESLPPNAFDAATLSAAREWRFKPKVENGKRVKQAHTRARVVYHAGKISVHLGEWQQTS